MTATSKTNRPIWAIGCASRWATSTAPVVRFAQVVPMVYILETLVLSLVLLEPKRFALLVTAVYGTI